jgi:hypothetical protein
MEAHGFGVDSWYDYAKQAVMLQTDRPTALREAIQACRKGGTVSIPGVYGGIIDKVPIGAAFGKGLSMHMGQTHVQHYLPKLLGHIEKGDIDPSYIITHRLPLEQAPQAYKIFRDKQDECIKVVLTPKQHFRCRHCTLSGTAVPFDPIVYLSRYDGLSVVAFIRTPPNLLFSFFFFGKSMVYFFPGECCRRKEDYTKGSVCYSKILNSRP